VADEDNAHFLYPLLADSNMGPLAPLELCGLTLDQVHQPPILGAYLPTDRMPHA
jgi:hypothetical protein